MQEIISFDKRVYELKKTISILDGGAKNGRVGKPEIL